MWLAELISLEKDWQVIGLTHRDSSQQNGGLWRIMISPLYLGLSASEVESGVLLKSPTDYQTSEVTFP